MNSKKKQIAMIVVVYLIVFFFFWLSKTTFLDRMEIDSSAVDWEGRKETEKNSSSETIAIPGFETVRFNAKETSQMVNFHNPETNECYFKLTMIHPNGTVLWESNLIEPGKGIYSIKLKDPIEKGEYEKVVLKYECFTLTDQSPLNGSEINFKLIVT